MQAILRMLGALTQRNQNDQQLQHAADNNMAVVWHQVWRALLRGENERERRRPPLPIELVRLISRLAGLRVPDDSRSHIHSEEIVVRSDGPIATKLWFCTLPFDDFALAHVAAAQLTTTSHDQGWASESNPGSYTWFSWGVFPSRSEAEARLKDESDAGPWRESHRNKAANPAAQDLEGPVVGVEDDLWDKFTIGSVIAVRVRAQYPAWANHAQHAEVKYWKWFEPVVDIA
ncbi:hypothetical protein BDW22DRAFT_1360236 [Trametopsis cervina]|nr:hypothetical protein BDW22DRAFT_1360236 [Trametopsis cervina]